GPVQAGSAARRVGLRVRRRSERRRDLHQLPAQETRSRPDTAGAHGSRGRLHPAGAATGAESEPMSRPRSLRRRLLSIVVLLLIGGLLIAEVVTYTQLRTFLYRRIDEQLTPIMGVLRSALVANGEQLSALGTPVQMH